MNFGSSATGHVNMKGPHIIEYFVKEGTDREKEFIPRKPLSDEMIGALRCIFSKEISVALLREYIHRIEAQNEITAVVEEWSGEVVAWVDDIEALIIGVSETGSNTLLLRMSMYPGQSLRSSFDIAAVGWAHSMKDRWRPYATKYLIGAILAALGLYYLAPGPALLLGGIANVLYMTSSTFVALYIRQMLSRMNHTPPS